ncbi:MAG TPA: hypothetical protein PK005_04890, partial [Bacteroidales bacterium]|nr:hypothetical protein [Bacteroidales bacterium]HQI11803.1 hypothetical protein [Bacteroidales bacterium]
RSLCRTLCLWQEACCKTFVTINQLTVRQTGFLLSFFLKFVWRNPVKEELIPYAKAGSKANLTPVQIVGSQFGMV